MEDNNLEFPFDFQLKRSSVSIIGIGGGAGRIVNKMQACELPDTELSVFGMNRKEMEELSLPHKYLIGTDGLGSGKNKRFAELESKKTLQGMDKITSEILSCFIVCLGGGTGEGCIKNFLQKSVEMKTKVKLLVVTLPHSFEGKDKRRNAIGLLGRLKKLVDGIFVVDCDALPCNTISGLFEEADKKVIEILGSFVRLIVEPSRICFDFNDIRSFLGYHSNTKFVEYFTLSGSIDYLTAELGDMLKLLPLKYLSLDNISNLILAIYYNEKQTDDNIARDFMDVIHDCIMIRLKHTEIKWTMYDVPTMSVNIFRINFFTKCN